MISTPNADSPTLDSHNVEYDTLQCIVFPKSEETMTIQVPKGCTPNWFHRKMQELIFGVKWRKNNVS